MSSNKLRGIKKVSERILQDGRAIILTEKEIQEQIDAGTFNWSQIPEGTIKVNTDVGEMSIHVKLAGESTWSPTNIHNSDAIEIKRDASIIMESYTIENADKGDGTFSYFLNWMLQEGGQDPVSRNGQLSAGGGQVFSLVKGDYLVNKNKIEVIINNEKIYSQEGGGILELTPESFELIEAVPTGTNIVVKYIQEYNIDGIGSSPNIFYGADEPLQASTGDLWFKKID